MKGNYFLNNNIFSPQQNHKYNNIYNNTNQSVKIAKNKIRKKEENNKEEEVEDSVEDEEKEKSEEEENEESEKDEKTDNEKNSDNDDSSEKEEDNESEEKEDNNDEKDEEEEKEEEEKEEEEKEEEEKEEEEEKDKKKKDKDGKKNKKNKRIKKKKVIKKKKKIEEKEIKEKQNYINDKLELNLNNIEEEKKYQYLPLKYEENNNKNIYELKKEKNKLDDINLDDNGKKEEKCESLKKLEEIENDLVEISENIEKIYLKLDSSLIQDEKYLIDSLVIEAKKKGILEENFEISGEKEDKKLEKENNIKPLETSSSKENKKIKNNNINNSNKKKVNMREIYNIKQNENNIKKNYYPYDPNKHKAYYEALNNKMMKSNESNASNRSNYLKTNMPTKYTNNLYQNENNKVYNYQMENNANNYNNNNNNFENKITNPYNVNNNISNNISNNLLSSTDTTGPYRYMRKNRKDEPNLIDLLMEK